MARRVEQVAVILVGEVRREQADRGQRERALPETIQDQRKASCRAGRRDPMVRRRLREMEPLGAVGEERGAAVAQVQPARVEFRERRDEIGGGVVRAPTRRVTVATRSPSDRWASAGALIGMPSIYAPDLAGLERQSGRRSETRTSRLVPATSNGAPRRSSSARTLFQGPDRRFSQDASQKLSRGSGELFR